MWQHVKLSEQIRPWDTLACCWDVEQPTNKQPPPPPPQTPPPAAWQTWCACWVWTRVQLQGGRLDSPSSLVFCQHYSTKTECDYLYGWNRKLAYAKISPKRVNPRDIAGDRRRKRSWHRITQHSISHFYLCSVGLLRAILQSMLLFKICAFLGDPLLSFVLFFCHLSVFSCFCWPLWSPREMGIMDWCGTEPSVWSMDWWTEPSVWCGTEPSVWSVDQCQTEPSVWSMDWCGAEPSVWSMDQCRTEPSVWSMEWAFSLIYGMMWDWAFSLIYGLMDWAFNLIYGLMWDWAFSLIYGLMWGWTSVWSMDQCQTEPSVWSMDWWTEPSVWSMDWCGTEPSVWSMDWCGTEPSVWSMDWCGTEPSVWSMDWCGTEPSVWSMDWCGTEPSVWSMEWCGTEPSVWYIDWCGTEPSV